MARIRSVHPKLWTDEDFVALPVEARLFLIALWGEADDYGLFEWKPLGLKMRIAPADNIDASGILDALKASRFIVKIEREGRTFGVVRNFRKWQRPKNPSAPITPVDEEIAAIICLKADTGSPALPQPYPSPSVNSAQMEDVGGVGVGEGKKIDHQSHLSGAQPSRATPVTTPEKPKPRPFPADGSISYGPFGEIARKAKPGVDPDVIATAFRRFIRSKDPPIPFDDPNIAARFEGFAKGHRVSH